MTTRDLKPVFAHLHDALLSAPDGPAAKASLEKFESGVSAQFQSIQSQLDDQNGRVTAIEDGLLSLAGGDADNDQSPSSGQPSTSPAPDESSAAESAPAQSAETALEPSAPASEAEQAAG